MTNLNEVATFIKARVKIKDVILAYANRQVRFDRCACPLHNGSDLNFQIYPDSNSYYCWVCHKHGDVINFVTDLLEIAPLEAMQKLDADFNVGAFGDHTEGQKRRYKRVADEQEQKRRKEMLDRDRAYDNYHELVQIYKALEDIRSRGLNDSPESAGRWARLWADCNRMLDEAENKIAEMEGRV